MGGYPPPQTRTGKGQADIAQQLAELPGSPARTAALVPMLSIFNLGEADDYPVPDGGPHRDRESRVYYRTVGMAVEIVSPEDGTWDKLGFHASRGVDELLIVDPQERRVTKADAAFDVFCESGH